MSIVYPETNKKRILVSYIESVIFTGDSQPGNNKKLYTFIKNNKTERCGATPLKHEGLTHADPLTKANILNRQFEPIFPNLNLSA